MLVHWNFFYEDYSGGNRGEQPSWKINVGVATFNQRDFFSFLNLLRVKRGNKHHTKEARQKSPWPRMLGPQIVPKASRNGQEAEKVGTSILESSRNRCKKEVTNAVKSLCKSGGLAPLSSALYSQEQKLSLTSACLPCCPPFPGSLSGSLSLQSVAGRGV